MGQLKNFNLNTYIDKYNCQIFVETGTGTGEGLSYACNFPFHFLFSIEIYKEVYDVVSQRFSNNANVKLINSDSITGIEEIFKEHSEKNCLFWLDAHYPGADYGYQTNLAEKNIEIRTPLEYEIKKISGLKNISNDVFILDDLRIYEDGPFQSGNLPEELKTPGRNINFIREIFDETHTLQKMYGQEGYMILTPK